MVLLKDGTWKYDRSAGHNIFSGDKNKTEPDIRNACWGNSFRQVKSLENITNNEWLEYEQDGIDIRAFETQVAGMKALFSYWFVDDKLTGAVYIISEYHSNENEYVTDFNRLHDILSKKYGKQEIKEEWHVDDWKDNIKFIGHALEQGHVDMSCFWKTTTTEIYHSITGTDYEIEHIVRY